MAEVLERSRAQNQLLAQKSLAIQEQERRYLAHELHDELGQSISAIKALAVSIGQRANAQADIAASAQTITDTSQRIYDVVRGMMRRLRPVILDELGLVPALQTIIDEWNDRHAEAFCRFSTEGDLRSLGDDVQINVYRILQEALTNVGKHARASEVNIALRRTAHHGTPARDRLELQITDNGIGFDTTATKAGLGLLGMRERVEALNGCFDLQSAPQRGVTLNITVPLEGDRTND
jgi:glucose-6-phosphate-specific signal transduction histidine kinase